MAGIWLATGAIKLTPRRAKPVYRWAATCTCWVCSDVVAIVFGLVRCPTCGKGQSACPRASSHRFDCSGSTGTVKGAP